jgi:CRISPR system Cascade subunit CasE
MSAKTPGASRGKRVDAVMHTKRPKSERTGRPSQDVLDRAALDWLLRRQDRLGVAFDEERCFASGYKTNRVLRREGAPITFASVDYEGALTVVDPARFANALAAGIGKAKAFGCGLLLIRPL